MTPASPCYARHSHSGVGCMTPYSVYYGQTTALRARRQPTLDVAFAADPTDSRTSRPRCHRCPRPPGSIDHQRRCQRPLELKQAHRIKAVWRSKAIDTVRADCLQFGALLRTRMVGGAWAGGEKPLATRLAVAIRSVSTFEVFERSFAKQIFRRPVGVVCLFSLSTRRPDHQPASRMVADSGTDQSSGFLVVPRPLVLIRLRQASSNLSVLV